MLTHYLVKDKFPDEYLPSIVLGLLSFTLFLLSLNQGGASSPKQEKTNPSTSPSKKKAKKDN